ncbi:MAG: hypothetical protein PHT32_02155 [Candidatus Omnitrophica bacterium]|nr:hypothetical protein [Candidatus Omnitrophota bacterium]
MDKIMMWQAPRLRATGMIKHIGTGYANCENGSGDAVLCGDGSAAISQCGVGVSANSCGLGNLATTCEIGSGALSQCIVGDGGA